MRDDNLVAVGRIDAAALLAWYGRFGRTHLPWRATRDPYTVLVSEFMLQQTQVERVIPLHAAFMSRWPTFAALAVAERSDVVRAWRGLGYNSRAVRLHVIAQRVVERFAGALPRDTAALRELPGIGAYTASALRIFAFDEPDIALDTNLRRIVHRVAFGIEEPPQATDAQLDAIARSWLPPTRSHDWNSALMDIGSSICRARDAQCLLCPLSHACASAPLDALALKRARASRAPGQSQATLPFERTRRYLRGRIVDVLRDAPIGTSLSVTQLIEQLQAIIPNDRLPEIEDVADVLVRDAIVVRDSEGAYRLA